MKHSLRLHVVFSLAMLLLLWGCGGGSSQSASPEIIAPTPVPTPTPPEGPSDKPNILLVIADDMGKDATNGFAEGSIKPTTPNLDAIQDGGLSFSNFWTYPVCTPTRASIITGKYGYRTNVKWANDVLSRTEQSLQSYINSLDDTDYATAIIGKWHLSANAQGINPEDFGIDHYAGIITGAVDDYYDWVLTEDTQRIRQTGYATEVLTDRAINWVANDTDNKPWFLWMAYNAPHTPFHVPPTQMHMQGALPDYEDGMDFQIGRLLDSLPADERENTVIIFIGDNGTPATVAQRPYLRSTAKGTLYQGGINTPLFVYGAGVTRTGTDPNLVTSTDLFATIAGLAGATVNQINDSQSMVSLFSEQASIRDVQYSEMDDGSLDAWTISDGFYKLIINSLDEEQLYSLSDDPYESNNLILNTLSMEQQSALENLKNELAAIRN